MKKVLNKVSLFLKNLKYAIMKTLSDIQNADNALKSAFEMMKAKKKIQIKFEGMDGYHNIKSIHLTSNPYILLEGHDEETRIEFGKIHDIKFA